MSGHRTGLSSRGKDRCSFYTYKIQKIIITLFIIILSALYTCLLPTSQLEQARELIPIRVFFGYLSNAYDFERTNSTHDPLMSFLSLLQAKYGSISKSTSFLIKF